MNYKNALKASIFGLGVGFLAGLIAATITVKVVSISDNYVFFIVYPIILGIIGLITGIISLAITKIWRKIILSIISITFFLLILYLIFMVWALNL